MRIAQLTQSFLDIPPKGRGGTEIVAHHLTEELVKRGLDVTLFASGASKTSATLESVFPRALYDEKDLSRSLRERYIEQLTSHCYQMAGQFDIIHCHADVNIRNIFFSPLVKTPTLTTIHDEIDQKMGRLLTAMAASNHYVSISDSQRKPVAEVAFAGTVYNGIDMDSFKFFKQPEDYVATFGRITPKKGVHTAINVAKAAGMPLSIAGKRYTDDDLATGMKVKAQAKYWGDEIEPHIDGSAVSFIGEIPNTEANAFLGKAKAVLFPIEWEEPFGLVMIEAMASGTPVVAYRRGAVEEVVEDGITGFIVDNEEQMAEALKNIDQIDRKKCRERVQERFSLKAMVDGYEELYSKIVGAKNA